MKRIVLSVLTLLLLAAALPVFAQDSSLTAEEQEAVQLVADAVAAINELDSFSIHSEQTISQDMNMTMGQQSMTITNDINQIIDIQVVKTADGYDVQGTMEQNIVSDTAGQTATIELVFEIVQVGGESYIRVSGDAGALSSMLPDGWVSLDDPSLVGNPLLSTFNAETITRLYDQNIPIDADSVISIQELDEVEVDGQTLRVFELQYDPSALVESGAFDSMSSMGGGNMTPEEGQQMLQDMFEGAGIVYTVYVGDDGLVRQLDSVVSVDAEITVQGLTLPLVMTVESSTMLTDFNQPITIEAPELGS